MSLSRKAKRRDANEPAIIQALERVGAEVWVIDRPADLMVWYRKRWTVIEVKMPHSGRFTALQSQERNEGLAEGILVVRTPLEALEAIGAISNGASQSYDTSVGLGSP